ncbi:P-loop containing nucleoside triphosphate hydrolase protein [Dipodascopsis uninucleata]
MADIDSSNGQVGVPTLSSSSGERTLTRQITFNLNKAQCEAVKYPIDSQLQILAGPGTGKTKTLVARALFYLAEGVRPENMIITTFTTKAANEMRERISSFLQSDSVANSLILGTFHSISRRYLLKYGYLISLPRNFQIADDNDSVDIVRSIIRSLKKENDKGRAIRVRKDISYLKSHGIESADYDELPNKEPELAEIFTMYQAHLDSSAMLDFDDLLLKCAHLLKNHPHVIKNVEAVLVDEFQDTNVVQYQLMKLFASAKSNITVVGDPDQSIYRFRAANIHNLKNMLHDYPDTATIHLEHNYRSSAEIVQASLSIIEQDDLRIKKSLMANDSLEQKPSLVKLLDDESEATWIAREIERIIKLGCGLIRPCDIAVLVRSARLTRPIEAKLAASGIDYRMIGGLRFYEREEIKLMMSYLSVVQSRKNSPAVRKTLNNPKRGIGEKFLETVTKYSEVNNISLWNALLDVRDGKIKVHKRYIKSLSDYISIITKAEELLKEHGLPDMFNYILEALDYKEVLKRERPETWMFKWENVQELYSQIVHFSTHPSIGNQLPDVSDLQDNSDTRNLSSQGDYFDSLTEFLATVNLSPTEEQASSKDPDMLAVISTIHSAKGLEWPVVFVPGVYDGSIPHKRSVDNSEEIDEERRLLYVAMTRAKGLLYLTMPTIPGAGFIGTFGDSSMKDIRELKRSRFIDKASLQCFQAKEPRFQYEDIRSLAGLLQRQCPPKSDISEARALWCAISLSIYKYLFNLYY